MEANGLFDFTIFIIKYLLNMYYTIKESKSHF